MSDLQVGQRRCDTQSERADLHLLPNGQTRRDAHADDAVGNLLQVGQNAGDTHTSCADLHLLPDIYGLSDTHQPPAVADASHSTHTTGEPMTTFSQLVSDYDYDTEADAASSILAKLSVNDDAYAVLFPLVRNAVAVIRRSRTRTIERAAFGQAGSDDDQQQPLPGDEPRLTQHEARMQLMRRTFRIPGQSVEWGLATVEQHEARIAMQARLMGDIGLDIERHAEAIAEIQAAGVTCLAEAWAVKS